MNQTQPNAAQWVSAAAAVGTLATAVIAILVALSQVKQARELRKQSADQDRENRRQTLDLDRRRSQPSVVVSLESSGASQMIKDLVIRNYGQTPARDVRPAFTPKLQRTSGDNTGAGEDLVLPEVIPFLAPGQEFRATWDAGRQYLPSGLPDRVDVKVTYVGVENEALSSESVLDWGIYRSVRYVQVYGLHDAAKALINMERRTKTWTEGNAGISVITRRGAAKDAASVRRYESWRQSSGELPKHPHRTPPKRRAW